MSSVAASLRSHLGEEAVAEASGPYLHDATEARGLRGSGAAVVRPADAEEVARTMRWCYEHDVPMTPRGGGTGFAGGAVPVGEEVVVDLGRLERIRALDPALWRAQVEAGVLTSTLQRRALETGLMFPPDPGAAEQSQIGGNIATNAGGPHAFKYGVTGSWVMGLEAVVPPGELIELGGALRKDVAGYDLKSLLIGSEGTLGIITSAWLRLLPAPAAAFPVVGIFGGIDSGTEAIEAVLALGIDVAAIEYLDPTALALAGPSSPWGPMPDGAFAVIAEVDGTLETASANREEVLEGWSASSLQTFAPLERAEIAALWRWRDGLSLAVQAEAGGKISEDIVVPLDRLREAIEGTVEIGAANDLPCCSWGHAGDGNLHSTFLLDPARSEQLRRAERAAGELFALAVSLGGSVSGEHGIGLVKSGQLRRQWAPGAIRLHRQTKEIFDPKGLLNPGKKLA